MAWTRIKCPYCDGAGHRRLSPVYQRTLDLLRQHGEATGADLARIEGCGATAMNNRLAALWNLQLVNRRRQGRKVFYRAT